jgi:hypothetical protein
VELPVEVEVRVTEILFGSVSTLREEWPQAAQKHKPTVATTVAKPGSLPVAITMASRASRGTAGLSAQCAEKFSFPENTRYFWRIFRTLG